MYSNLKVKIITDVTRKYLPIQKYEEMRVLILLNTTLEEVFRGFMKQNERKQ